MRLVFVYKPLLTEAIALTEETEGSEKESKSTYRWESGVLGQTLQHLKARSFAQAAGHYWFILR